MGFISGRMIGEPIGASDVASLWAEIAKQRKCRGELDAARLATHNAYRVKVAYAVRTVRNETSESRQLRIMRVRVPNNGKGF